MGIALISSASLLTVAARGSTAGKSRKLPNVVQNLLHVGVRDYQLPLLALLEIAAGVGLLVGFATSLPGRLAAAGLVLYFLGAVVAHQRVRSEFKVIAPALFLFALAVVTLIVEITH